MVEQGWAGRMLARARRLWPSDAGARPLVVLSRQRLLVAAGAAGVALVTLAVFAPMEADRFRGVPSVVLIQAATVIAVAIGPLPGVVAGALFAVVFRGVVAEAAEGSEWNILLWAALAGLAGVLALVVGRRQSALERQHAATVRLLGLLQRMDTSSPEAVVRSICGAAIDVFRCDSATVWRLGDGERMQLVWRTPPDDALRPGTEVSLADEPGLRAEVASGEIGFRSLAIPEDLTAVEREHMEAHRISAALRLPIPAPGITSTVLGINWHDPIPPPSEAELQTAERFADLAALSWEQALRERAQREVAELTERLQTGLLPAPNVSQDSVSVATRYRPGEKRLLLGGDFYDMVQRDSGELLVLIGDVAGHGVEAAALAARLRSSWRALALTGAAPNDVVDQLDRLLRYEAPSAEMFATACAAVLSADQRQLSLILAGHPPPALLRDAGVHLLEQPVEPPLGLAGTRSRGHPSHELGDDWTLLFFTDGLFEGRREPSAPQRLGLDGLVRRLGTQVNLTGHPVDLDLLVHGIEADHGGGLDDDVALVMVSRRPLAISPGGDHDTDGRQSLQH